MARTRRAQYAPPPLKLEEYCEVCHYPLREVPCGECQDRKRAELKLIDKYVEQIGGVKAWREHTTDRFVKTAYNSKAYAAALAFNPKTSSLLLHGPRGTGKTHLAGIAKRKWILNGAVVVTVSMPDVIDQMIQNMKSQKVTDDLVGRLINSPVLSIEDVGAGEKNSEFIVKLYFRVIDGRYKADRHGLILTTNHSLDDLEQMWQRFDQPGRIVSRLQEMCRGNIYSLNGERDWRKGDQ